MTKNKLTPPLRFPEFRNPQYDFSWRRIELKQVLVERREKNARNLLVCSVARQKGVVSQIEHLGRSFAAKNTANYNVVRYGDLVYTKSPTGGFPYGIVKQSQLQDPVAVSPLYAVYKPINYAVGFILHCCFGCKEYANNYLYSLVQKGAKNTINITNQHFLEKELILPMDEREQQEIVKCLSSLEELIALQSEKLDLLYTHKRGVMQQLFPEGGEVVPKLRFPDFKKAPVWEPKKLDILFEERQDRGATNFPLLSLLDKEGIILQSESKRKDNSNSDKSRYLRVCPGDIAYNTMRMWEGRSALVQMDGLVSPAYTVCKPREKVCSRFFAFHFKTFQAIRLFEKYSQGLAKDTLNLKFKTFSEILFPVPLLDEQQQIAACLSSLDDLIAVQSKIVESLRDHQKGLMQQFFPSVREVGV